MLCTWRATLHLRQTKGHQSVSFLFWRERFELSLRRFAKQTARAWSTAARGARKRECDKGENKECRKRASSSEPRRLCFRVGRRNATHFDTLFPLHIPKKKSLNRKIWGLSFFFCFLCSRVWRFNYNKKQADAQYLFGKKHPLFLFWGIS